MDREVEAVGLGLVVDAEGRDEFHDKDDRHGDGRGKHSDDGEAAQLGGPAACAEGGNHDRAEDATHAVHGEDIECVVDLQRVANEVDRFLAEDAGDRADQQGFNRADKARGRGDRRKARDGAGDEADK